MNALIIPVLVFSCSVLVSLLIMRYGMMPRWEALTANRAVLERFKDSILKENGKASLIQQLTYDRDSLTIKNQNLMGEIGGTHDLSGVLQMIIAKANAADIKFVKMQPQAEIKAGTSMNYPIILECTASYYSYGRFIAALETRPSVMRVDRIAMTAQKNGLLDIRTLVTCFIQTKS